MSARFEAVRVILSHQPCAWRPFATVIQAHSTSSPFEALRVKRDRRSIVDGSATVTIETVLNDESRLHDYGLSRSTWIRGVRILKALGADGALDAMDDRASSALDRGHMRIAERWRDLMAVIHAVLEDEPKAGDRVH